MQTVGMIGLGALGVLFGQRLMANGADVRVLADKTRAEKYQKQGVTCNGAPRPIIPTVCIFHSP